MDDHDDDLSRDELIESARRKAGQEAQEHAEETARRLARYGAAKRPDGLLALAEEQEDDGAAVRHEALQALARVGARGRRGGRAILR